MTATIARLELNPHDPNARAAPSCLLCGSSQYAIDQSLDAEGIFRCWAIEGRRFSDTVRRPLLQEGTIHLYRCRQCGFQFFNPRLAGSSEFYEQIAAGGDDYYAPDRPENERNARYALKRGFRNILDVGCGTGFALDAAKALGLETFGIELNRRAGGIAAGRGHRVFPVLLEEMEAAWEGKFDMISLNQLLEHVPEPVTLIRQCRRFLSPDGVIAIAVPGRDGILRFSPWLASNWPPHHLSRWRRCDFHSLARLADLRVLETGGDRLAGSFMKSILLGHRQYCQVLGKTYRGLPAPAIAAAAQVYRKLGFKYIFASQGLSIYCYLNQAAGGSAGPTPQKSPGEADDCGVSCRWI